MKIKGAVPIPYIIAIILGIIVVSAVGYWFIYLGHGFWGEVTVQSCNSKKQMYCNIWAAAGYPSGEDAIRDNSCVDDEGNVATWGTAEDWACYAPGCAEIGVNVPTVEECTS